MIQRKRAVSEHLHPNPGSDLPTHVAKKARHTYTDSTSPIRPKRHARRAVSAIPRRTSDPTNLLAVWKGAGVVVLDAGWATLKAIAHSVFPFTHIKSDVGAHHLDRFRSIYRRHRRRSAITCDGFWFHGRSTNGEFPFAAIGRRDRHRRHTRSP